MFNKNFLRVLFPALPSILISALLGSLLVLTLTSCGQNKPSSRSLKEYEQIKKTMGPVHDQPTIKQNYIQTDLYSINAENIPKVIFEVGQTNVLRINTSLKLPGTQYRLVSRDLPEGSTLSQASNTNDGVWLFTWTPETHLMSSFRSGIYKRFHVSIEVIDSSDPQAKEIAQSLSAETAIDYTLDYPKSAPEILSIEGTVAFPKATKINEGDRVHLVIRVKDSSASLAQKPVLITPRIQDKIHGVESIIDGSRFFYLQSEAKLIDPKQVNGLENVWEFQAEFNTRDFSLIAPASESGKPPLQKVISNLIFEVQGANGKSSPQRIASFEITLRQELLRPAFKVLHPELELQSQNSTFKFEFESYLPSSVGTVNTFISEETTKLPGTPKLINCKSVSEFPSRKKCTLSWDIPCSQAPGDVTLKIVAAGDFNGQTTFVEYAKKITVVEHKKCVKTNPSKPKSTEPTAVPLSDPKQPTSTVTTPAVETPAPSTGIIIPRHKPPVPEGFASSSQKSASQKNNDAKSNDSKKENGAK